MIGLALRIVVSVTTDVTLAPEAGLVFDALLGWLSRGTGPRHLAACGVPALAIAGSARTVRADYGVMQLDGAGAGAYQVQGYDERSETPVVVSIGIYVLDPSALAHILAGGPLDSPDLVLALIAAGEPVGSHVHHGYRRDIGRHDDYEDAQAEIDVMLPELLPA